MARGKLGSFVGTVTAGVDMIPILAQGKTPPPQSTGFIIRKIAIHGIKGLKFTVNDAEIELTDSGIFETSEDMVEIRRLIFQTSDNVNIRYLY